MATVSRVLAGNYPTSAEAKRRVLEAIDELDYVANVHARRLAGQGARTIAILVEQVTSDFYATVAQAIEQQASLEGRLCLICTTGGDADRELALIDMLREQGTDAVIIVGGYWSSREYEIRMARYAESLHAAGSLLVLCGRPALEAEVPHVVVTYDNEEGAYAAAGHLASRGHEDILFVGGAPGMSAYERRAAGWRRALQDHGLPTEGRELLGGFTAQFGHAAMRERLAGGRDFTAVMAYNDDVAAGVARALREAGVAIPEEVSLIGYDDALIAGHLTPALTTVSVPAQELGRSAVRLALAAQEDPPALPAREVVLATHVVVRDSVATAPRRSGVGA